MANSTNVPAQFLGYSIQTTRMACLLLSAPKGSAVSLEVFEDVGITYENGSKLAQQAKSSTSSQNPISDFSKEMWKTFFNWVNSIDQKILSAEYTKFEIYISTAKDGNFAKKLSDAKTDEDVNAVLDCIADTFGERITKLSPDIANYVNRVLNFERSLLHALFKNFELVVGKGNVWDELLELLESNQAIPNEILEKVGTYILGWVKKEADAKIQQNLPAIITEAEFRSEFVAVIRNLDRGMILESFAPNPDKDDIDGEKIQTYVLQLDIIEADDDDKIQAINDYLRSKIERCEWSRRGMVTQLSFDNFLDDLLRVWRNSNTKVCITHGEKTDVSKGKLLLAECLGVPQNLQGLSVPSHFLAGSFHTMADTLRIGWHPLYKELLKPRTGNEEE